MGEETKSTLIKEIIFEKDRPISNIIIGDPMYFDMISNTTDKNRLKTLKSLTVRKRIAKRNPSVTKIAIRHFHNEYKTLEWESYVICAVQGDDESVCDTYLNDEHFDSVLDDKTGKMKKVSYEEHQLGCDTAGFEISIDGTYADVHTGADGYYGMALFAKQKDLGFWIELELDDTVFNDFDDAIKWATYVFSLANAKKSKSSITTP